MLLLLKVRTVDFNGGSFPSPSILVDASATKNGYPFHGFLMRHLSKEPTGSCGKPRWNKLTRPQKQIPSLKLTAILHLKRWKTKPDHLPTINFQVLLLLVSGRVNDDWKKNTKIEGVTKINQSTGTFLVGILWKKPICSEKLKVTIRSVSKNSCTLWDCFPVIVKINFVDNMEVRRLAPSTVTGSYAGYGRWNFHGQTPPSPRPKPSAL